MSDGSREESGRSLKPMAAGIGAVVIALMAALTVGQDTGAGGRSSPVANIETIATGGAGDTVTGGAGDTFIGGSGDTVTGGAGATAIQSDTPVILSAQVASPTVTASAYLGVGGRPH